MLKSIFAGPSSARRLISAVLAAFLVLGIIIGVFVLWPLRVAAAVDSITVNGTVYKDPSNVQPGEQPYDYLEDPDNPDTRGALRVNTFPDFTLTMDDYTGGPIAINTSGPVGSNVFINLIDQNTINTGPAADPANPPVGLAFNAETGALTIQGQSGASLTIRGANNSAAEALNVKGDLTVTGGISLALNGGSLTAQGANVSAGNALTVSGSTTITGTRTTVVATGGNGAAAEGGTPGARGGAGFLLQGPSLTVTGANSLTARGGSSQYYQNAPGLWLAAEDAVPMVLLESGGNLTATGGSATGFDGARPYAGGPGLGAAGNADLVARGGGTTLTLGGGSGSGNGNSGGPGLNLNAGQLTVRDEATLTATGGNGSLGSTNDLNPDGLGGSGAAGVICGYFTATAAGRVTSTGGNGANGSNTNGAGGAGITCTTPIIDDRAVVAATGGRGGEGVSAGVSGGGGGIGFVYEDDALIIQSDASLTAKGGNGRSEGGHGVQGPTTSAITVENNASLTAEGGNGQNGGFGLSRMASFKASGSAVVTATGGTGLGGTNETGRGGDAIHINGTPGTFVAESSANIQAQAGDGAPGGDAIFCTSFSATGNVFASAKGGAGLYGSGAAASGGHGIRYRETAGAPFTLQGNAIPNAAGDITYLSAIGGAGGTGASGGGRGIGGDGIYIPGAGAELSIDNATLETRGGNGTGGGSIGAASTVVEGGSGIRTGGSARLDIVGERSNVTAQGGEAGVGAQSIGGFGAIIGGDINISDGARVNAQGGHTHSVGSTSGTRGGDGLLSYGAINISGSGPSQNTSVTAGGGDARASAPTGAVTGGYGIYASSGLTVQDGALATGVGGEGGAAGPGGTGVGAGTRVHVFASARLEGIGGDSVNSRGGYGVMAGITAGVMPNAGTSALEVTSGRLHATAGDGPGGERIAVLSATVPEVYGGTSVIAGSVKYPTYDANRGFIITGGSWHITAPGDASYHNATRADGTPRVYCVAIQLSGLAGGRPVTNLGLKTSAGDDITGYGLDEVYTDEEGKIYIWLPEGAYVLSVTSNGVVYLPRNAPPIIALPDSSAAATYWPLGYDSSTSASTSGSDSGSGSSSSDSGSSTSGSGSSTSASASGSTSGSGSSTSGSGSSTSASGSTSGSASGSTSGSGSRSGTSGAASTTAPGAPQTSDPNHPMLWFGLSCAALALLAMLLVLRKKALRR